MSTINLKNQKNIKPAHNVVLCDMLPTKNHKLGLWSFSWENLHTYELSCTWFHRVQGEEVGLPSVFEKFKKNQKKSPKLYFKVNKKDLNLVFHFHILNVFLIVFILKHIFSKENVKIWRLIQKIVRLRIYTMESEYVLIKKHLAHLE